MRTVKKSGTTDMQKGKHDCSKSHLPERNAVVAQVNTLSDSLMHTYVGMFVRG